MIDTHAHLDFKDFDGLRDDMIQRFFEAGGEALINVGCDMRSSQKSIELAQSHEKIFAAVGIHPHDADSATEENLSKLEDLLLSPKAVAVGEIGLDFYREPFCEPDAQKEAFRRQLEIAEARHKPVILHCREAYAEVLEILREYKAEGWRGVLHCFTASPEVAQEFLSLGFHLSFTVVITYYKPGSADESFLLDTLRQLPLERLMVETDAPYLSPAPHRGEINEPLFTRYIIERIAQLRGMDAKELESVTSRNARELFGL
jgi:TatD DNase family protein